MRGRDGMKYVSSALQPRCRCLSCIMIPRQSRPRELGRAVRYDGFPLSAKPRFMFVCLLGFLLLARVLCAVFFSYFRDRQGDNINRRRRLSEFGPLRAGLTAAGVHLAPKAYARVRKAKKNNRRVISTFTKINRREWDENVTCRRATPAREFWRAD